MLSVAVIENWKWPPEPPLYVPDTAPAAVSDRPFGSEFDENVYVLTPAGGTAPPVAVNVTLYAAPWVALGSSLAAPPTSVADVPTLIAYTPMFRP